MPTATQTIDVQNLTMTFGDTTALRNISVQFGGERIYGLLGRNGAGKTTLLNLINNRLIPVKGKITIDGNPALENDQAQGLVYYMGEKNLLPDTTTVKQFFRWTALFYPGFDESEAYRLAGLFELPVKKKLKNLSTGYLSIAKLCAALATRVPYLLLDEPVLGLDANHRDLFYKELIENYSKFPRTIVISTHLIEEVSDIVEQVVIIKKGQLLLDKPAEEVKQMGYSVSGKSEMVDAYCQDKEILSMDTLGGLKTACLLGKPAEVPPDLEITALDMQKLFIHLTNT